MPLEKLGNILRSADKKNTAAIGFNCMSNESIDAIITAGESLGIPVIAMLYPDMQNLISVETFAAVTKTIAEKAGIPVGLHLDHCQSLETIKTAMEAGFTSVMIDGSRLPYKENLEITKKVVEMAKKTGVHVEAELGLVGTASNKEDFKDSSLYTDPGQAAEFAQKTGVDALAIAIGNAHGFYIEEPVLDLEVLSAINSATETPLVLHGGSGISDDQLRESFRRGINKLNVGTEYFAAFHSAIKSYAAQAGGKDDYFTFLEYQKTKVNEYLKNKLLLTKV